MTLLSVRDLRASYETEFGSVKAVDGVSLDVAEGDSVAVVGESGSGKSTLAFSILRLLRPPGRVAGGQVLFEGKDMLSMREEDLNKIRGGRIGMIFQQPQAHLNPVLKAGFQVAEVLQVHRGFDKEAAINEAIGLLKEAGVPSPEETINRYPHELSGGMAQRVVIAMALACSPSLVIADEPTSALDVTVQAQILETIKKLRTSHRTSLILITHDLSLAAEACERIVVMYAGKLVESGTSEDIFGAPKHPYTQLLMASIPKVGPSSQIQEIPGAPPDLANPPPGCRFHPRCPYVMKECPMVEPQLRSLGGTRMVACHLYKEES